MSISMDGMAAMLDTSSMSASNYNANKVQNTLGNLSSETKDDELMQVCKDFESYFIEEIIKEVKNNMTLEDEEEDSSLSTLTDFHMDSAVELIADQVSEQSGSSFSQQLYEQMKRNYGIE